jgi:hypothetical protein
MHFSLTLSNSPFFGGALIVEDVLLIFTGEDEDIQGLWGPCE